MKSVFISYSHENMADVDVLEKVLKASGLTLWRDISHMELGQMESQVKSVLSQPDLVETYLLVATPESWASSAVQEWELKTVLKRIQQGEHIGICILLDDQFSMEKLRAESLSKYAIDLTKYLLNFAQKDKLADYLSAAKNVIRHKLKHTGPTQKNAVLNLHSYAKTAFLEEALLEIDLGLFYENGKLPMLDEWQKIIIPAWLQLRALLAEKGILHLTLQPKLELTAAFAFGRVFHRTSGFQHVVKDYGEIWDMNIKLSGTKPLYEFPTIGGDLASRNVILEISVTREVNTSVQAFIQEHKFDYRARCMIGFKEPGNWVVKDNQHAIDIAYQVVEKIRSIADEYGLDKEVHLFYAGSQVIAIMIGYLLNAQGNIWFHPYHKVENKYVEGIYFQAID